MAYMAEDVEMRLDPARLVPGARSVVVVADRYADGRPDARVPGRGRIARYARGEDYHLVIRARLEALAEELRAAHPRHRFRVCVDTAPLLEREHAERAGIGRIGKHTLLIGRDGAGSWLLLGAIVTTLELEPTGPGDRAGLPAAPEGAPAAAADPCGTCTRCIEACPTGAITPWRVDARRCISHATIEDPGVVDASLGARHADWIFGCDICQEVCPHNAPTRRSTAMGAHPAYAAHWSGFDLLAVLGWTESDWAAARLHGALRRATRAMWVRNAALAAIGALADPSLPGASRAALRSALARLASDPAEDPAVRAAAALAE
jgi:epoxyqueuosine reductase